MDWKHALTRVAAEIEAGVDRTRHALDRRLGRDRPVRVEAYRGYGTPDRVRVRGRVLYGDPPGPAAPTDRWWINLRNALRRIESDEVPGARVRVAFGGERVEATADAEGHFVAELRPGASVPADRLWHQAIVELVDPPGVDAVATSVALPRGARFGIVSDLDDTVLRTDARNALRGRTEERERDLRVGPAHAQRVPQAAEHSLRHHARLALVVGDPGHGDRLERLFADPDLTGIMTRTMSDQASAIGRLFHGYVSTRRTTISFEIAGAAGALMPRPASGRAAERARPATGPRG